MKLWHLYAIGIDGNNIKGRYVYCSPSQASSWQSAGDIAGMLTTARRRHQRVPYGEAALCADARGRRRRAEAKPVTARRSMHAIRNVGSAS